MPQAGDHEAFGAEEVGQHVPGPDAGKLVRITDEQQVCSGRDGLDQLIGQQGVEHADLVNRHQVGFQRVLQSPSGLAAGAQFEQAVQRRGR